MLIKTAYKTYTKLKKMGKFSKDNFMKALKDSGIEEIVDIAGDLFTIVDPTSSWIDVTKAIIDVTTGLETNNKGNKAAEEAMDKASDLVKGSKKADDVVDVVKAKKTHGNKLDDKPAEGYTLRDKKSGDVKKYGETTRGEDKYGAGNQKRYSKKELKEKDVYYQKETSGTKKEMHKWQNGKIKEHKSNNNGDRPRLNKSDY